MQEKIWKPTSLLSKEEINGLSDKLGVPPLYALLFHRVGVASRDEMGTFMRPDHAQLHDPMLMRDMGKAVERITEARAAGQRVRVYGDYDVDGTTSVAVVYQFLQDHFEHIDHYIPDREKEGYGISELSIEDAIQKNIDLIIALDCGIRSVYLVDQARQNGVDFIICDHHTPGSELPNAAAVLNPKRSDCSYPFKELSGCGIGWKLISALSVHWELDLQKPNEYLDLVAVGVVTGEGLAAAVGGAAGNNMRAITHAHVGVETTGLAGDALENNLGFRSYEY